MWSKGEEVAGNLEDETAERNCAAECVLGESNNK